MRIANAQQDGERLYLGLERIRDLPPGTRGQIAKSGARERRRGRCGSASAKLLAILAYVGVPLLLVVTPLVATVGIAGIRNMIHALLRHFGI